MKYTDNSTIEAAKNDGIKEVSMLPNKTTRAVEKGTACTMTKVLKTALS
tara:strand:- start:88 stop:234 length:147 start_codon:yes stop_codon:yes gene_type:complete